MTPLNPARIGYLRQAVGNGSTPTAPANPAVKSMWRKLATEGFLTSTGTKDDHFARTAKGDEALVDFDKTLSEDCRAVLNGIRAGQSRVAVMKGIHTVLKAGLVVFTDEGKGYHLTEDGERLADPIGEEGYFTKSGNLVRVLSVCTDKGYEGLLNVERLAGESRGKQMLVPRDAFVPRARWEAENA